MEEEALTPTVWSMAGGWSAQRPTGEGPEGKGWGQQPGAQHERGTGVEATEITGPHLPQQGPGSKATASGSPKRGKGPCSQSPAKPCLPNPVTSDPARTHLAPAAPSGTAPSWWAGGGAGAGTQTESALPL